MSRRAAPGAAHAQRWAPGARLLEDDRFKQDYDSLPIPLSLAVERDPTVPTELVVVLRNLEPESGWNVKLACGEGFAWTYGAPDVQLAARGLFRGRVIQVAPVLELLIHVEYRHGLAAGSFSRTYLLEEVATSTSSHDTWPYSARPQDVVDLRRAGGGLLVIKNLTAAAVHEVEVVRLESPGQPRRQLLLRDERLPALGEHEFEGGIPGCDDRFEVSWRRGPGLGSEKYEVLLRT